LSSLPLAGLRSLTHLRLAGNTQLVELLAPEDLPRVRVMELPYAFQCCAFISCETATAGGRGGGGGGGGAGASEEAPDSAGSEPATQPGPADQVWEELLPDPEGGAELQQAVRCSPAPGPFQPCLHLLDGWLVRGGVWLTAALAPPSNGLVLLSVFCAAPTPPSPGRSLIGLLALANGLMGVWSGWLAAVDAWTYGSFWRYGGGRRRFGSRRGSSLACAVGGFLGVFSAQSGIFLLTLAALERCSQQRRRPAARTGQRSLPLWLRLAAGLCFLLGVAVALPPLVAGGGGGGGSSLCLPLP
ncbi:unnamed protein product, partial [Tetraodon nigroviridis]